MSLLGRVEEIDNQMDKITRLIDRSAADDPELGAGLASSRVVSAQSTVDKMGAAVEELDAHLRDIARRLGR